MNKKRAYLVYTPVSTIKQFFPFSFWTMKGEIGPSTVASWKVSVSLTLRFSWVGTISSRWIKLSTNYFLFFKRMLSSPFLLFGSRQSTSNIGHTINRTWPTWRLSRKSWFPGKCTYGNEKAYSLSVLPFATFSRHFNSSSTLSLSLILLFFLSNQVTYNDMMTKLGGRRRI